jgi:hypothetical protein
MRHCSFLLAGEMHCSVRELCATRGEKQVEPRRQVGLQARHDPGSRKRG